MLVVSAIRAGTTKRGFLMKRRKIVVGMLALALVSVMGLLGCASVDQQTLKKAGVAKDQRADLYLVMYDTRLEKIDDKKQGMIWTLYGALKGLSGALEETPKGLSEAPLNNRWYWPVQVSAGEHTIVISDKMLIGRKSYTGTFKFEAGKKYVMQVVNPSQYELMQKEGFDMVKDWAKDAGNALKEDLAGNKIIIIAESKKAIPTYPDYSLKGTDWKKSIK